MRAGHADLGLVEQRGQRLEVLGQRRLDVGPRAKHDQRQTLALAIGDEVGDDLLDRRQPLAGLTVGIDQVGLIHAAGDVHRQDQVAGGALPDDGFAEFLRTGQGEHDQSPHQRLCQPSQRRALAAARNRDTGGLHQSLKERQAQRCQPLAVGWQQPVGQ